MYYLKFHIISIYCCRTLSDGFRISDLNRLVMDYLVIEGYKSAAEEFSKEADINAPVDFQSIEDRTVIREALQRGDIDEAIVRVNGLDPEVGLILLPSSKGLYLSCTTLRPLCL